MMVVMGNFLDLWDIWVNELVGSVWLFIFLGVIVISYLSIKAKFSMQVTIIMNVIFISIVFAKATGLSILWVFILLGVSGFFYYVYQKVIRHG